MTTLILIAGSILHFLFGSLAYVRDTLKGESQPNRITFLIWALGPFIAVGASLQIGASWSLLPVFMSGFGPFCIFIASYSNPKAYWKLGVLDYVCGVLAVFALIALLFTKQPMLAIALSIAADALALLPTAIKAWKFPATETGITYVVALLNVLLGIAFTTEYTFSNLAFLVYLVLADVTLIVAVYRSRLFGSKSVTL